MAPKSLPDCVQLLHRLENDFPVNDWTVDGLGIWPVIRSLLFYRLSLSLRGPSADTPPARKRRLVDAHTARFREPKLNLPREAPAEAFVLSYSGIRQARVDGRFMDIRTGPLIERFDATGISCHTWEYAAPVTYRFPRKNATHLIQERFYRAQLSNRLRARKFRAVELGRYDEFSRVLEAENALFPDLRKAGLLREIGLIFALDDVFERAFDKINPRIAFTSNLGRYEFALHRVCRRRGILSVELQHGVQGPLHAQYSGWDRVPAGGYEVFPEAFWCWDEASAASINQWSARCAPHHRAVFSAVPWLEYCASLPPPAWDGDGGRKKGLVTLQPPDKIYADGRALPDFVLEAMSKAGPGWVWWVRPHPAAEDDLAALTAELKRRGLAAEIEPVRVEPLPKLLSRADLHLTHSSSSVLEAEALGVPSIVWSDLGADLYATAVTSGACRVARDAASLTQAIETAGKGGVARVAPTAPSYIPTLDAFLKQARKR